MDVCQGTIAGFRKVDAGKTASVSKDISGSCYLGAVEAAGVNTCFRSGGGGKGVVQGFAEACAVCGQKVPVRAGIQQCIYPVDVCQRNSCYVINSCHKACLFLTTPVSCGGLTFSDKRD